MGSLDDAVAAYNKPESERTPAEVAMVYDILSRDGRIKPAAWPKLLDGPARVERQRLLARLDELKKAAPPPLPTARGIDESGHRAPPTYFLKRGEYTAAGTGGRAGVPVGPGVGIVRRSHRRPRRPGAAGRWPIG